MTNAPEVVDDVRLPASSAVLAELAQLRKRDGISEEAIDRLAPEIRSLPAVTDELEWRRLAVTDRHIAAYHALQCLIKRRFTDPIEHRILWVTLNYEHRPSDLGTRRSDLEVELSISKTKRELAEQRAYQHLANAAVAASQSPCRAPTAEEAAAAQERIKISFDRVEIETNSDAIVARLLSLLAPEDDPRIKIVIMRRILTRAQIAQRPGDVERFPPSRVRQDFDRLVKAAMPAYDAQYAKPSTIWQLLPNEALVHLLRSNESNIERRCFETAEIADKLRDYYRTLDKSANKRTARLAKPLIDNETEHVNARYYQIQAASIRLLANIIEGVTTLPTSDSSRQERLRRSSSRGRTHKPT